MKLASTTLVFVVSALLALGLVMLYSATMFHRSGGFLGSQLLWCCIGLVVLLISKIQEIIVRKQKGCSMT